MSKEEKLPYFHDTYLPDIEMPTPFLRFVEEQFAAVSTKEDRAKLKRVMHRSWRRMGTNDKAREAPTNGVEDQISFHKMGACFFCYDLTFRQKKSA